MLDVMLSKLALALATAISGLWAPALYEPAGSAIGGVIRAEGRPAPHAFELTGPTDHGELPFTVDLPANSRSEKLMGLVQLIEDTGTDTTYTHSTRVRRREGKFHFDCSGMMNWMLTRVAPKAREGLDRERPVAATYVRTIERAPTDRRRKGWQQIADIEDVRPGDLFAWRRPPTWPKGGNTGHVGIVVAVPRAVGFIEGAYLVKVVDSTRYAHQHDERSQTGDTGFGSGTILFMTDDQRHPIGYGWYGTQSGGWYETAVVFGRI